MPFLAIAIRNSNLYTESRREAQINKVLLELATIVFDESNSTVDNLVSRILFNSIFLLECQSCQVILLNTSANNSNNNNTGGSSNNLLQNRSISFNKNRSRRLSINVSLVIYFILIKLSLLKFHSFDHLNRR